MTILFGSVGVFLLTVIAFALDAIRDELRDIALLIEQQDDGGAPVPRRRVRRP